MRKAFIPLEETQNEERWFGRPARGHEPARHRNWASTPPKQMLHARKSLSRSREARTKHVYTDPYQAALLKTFFMPACIGAAITVVSFCAMPVRCRACSANASACLRACSADNSTNADGDFTPST